jgi:hypothetical protein
MAAAPDALLAMQGMMMKKKTSTPSILRPLTLEWVTRHFFLYEDGKMLYARDGASVDPNDIVLLCNNIADCHIDRAKASDMGKKKSHVANSFYITVPQHDDTDFAKTHKKRTLLVTHGPEEFKKWIAAFRKLRATVNMEVEEPAAKITTSPDRASLVPSVVSSEHEVKVSALNISDVKFGDSTLMVDIEKLEPIQDEDQRVHFSGKDQVFSVPAGSEKSDTTGAKGEKSVSFDESSMGEVIPDVDQLSEISGEDSGSERKVAFSEVRIANTEVINDIPESDKKVAFRSVTVAAESAVVIDDTTGPPLERKVSFRTVKETMENAEVIGDAPPLEKKVSFRMENDSDDVVEDEIPSDAPQDNANDATAKSGGEDDTKQVQFKDSNEGILYPNGCKDATVFAYGDSLDELAKALSAKSVLYGIVTTSLEENLDDETYANTTPQPSLSKLKAFSIEFMGNKADVIKAEKLEQHLSEVISFCKTASSVHDLHPIRSGDGQKVKDEILSVLQVIEDGNEEEEKEVFCTTPSGMSNFEYDSSSGLTAYKYAIQTQDPSDIPSGPQVLECVRQQMGVPYNWVVYQPSQTEMIVEDAGSGGVIEMTKVLHESYNDRVLFGLARVSFMGETFGRRQIWFALEWKGENCTSVKMIRQLRDCATKMNEFIGDRSFTMTNVSAADMTPDSVCAWVKRSCDVTDYTLSVDSMNSAHIDEQKVIKEYYEKLALKEAAIRSAKEAKRKEQLRKERLWLRQETRENAEPLREERKERWSKLSVPDILKDLGDKDDSLSGWVLLEFET